MTSGVWKAPAELVGLRERLADVFDAGGGVATDQGDASEAALSWVPMVDVLSSEGAIVVSTEVTGVDPAALTLHIEGGMLVIRGERQRATKGVTYHRLERAMGPFERAVELPVAVDPAGVEARVEEGVLTVRMHLSEIPFTGRHAINIDYIGPS